MKTKYRILILVLISLLALTGCKSDDQVTETTNPDMPKVYPAPAVNLPLVSSPGDSTPDSSVSNDSAASAPGYPPPSNAPVRENASQMQVEILSLAKSENDPDLMVARVRVNSTAAVEGFDQYDPNLAGQELDILLAVADASDLVVGDIINLTVSYRGDEWGGGYYGNGVTVEK